MSDLRDPEIFRAVLDSLQTGVLVAGRNGKILFWNQGADRMTGFMRHQALGHAPKTTFRCTAISRVVRIVAPLVRLRPRYVTANPAKGGCAYAIAMDSPQCCIPTLCSRAT
jgi:PAS domain-containing protein